MTSPSSSTGVADAAARRGFAGARVVSLHSRSAHFGCISSRFATLRASMSFRPSASSWLSRPRLLAMRARSARNTFLTLRCFVCSSTPLAASVASGGALPAGTGGKKSKPARCCAHLYGRSRRVETSGYANPAGYRSLFAAFGVSRPSSSGNRLTSRSPLVRSTAGGASAAFASPPPTPVMPRRMAPPSALRSSAKEWSPTAVANEASPPLVIDRSFARSSLSFVSSLESSLSSRETFVSASSTAAAASDVDNALRSSSTRAALAAARSAATAALSAAAASSSFLCAFSFAISVASSSPRHRRADSSCRCVSSSSRCNAGSRNGDD
mmetsp:Transcript_4435/g.15685  ORF Transcript_4435/g.15685 Transcript_4435/m.15685 type:complete len:326 (+) Transcript_4435:677-1654(+)